MVAVNEPAVAVAVVVVVVVVVTLTQRWRAAPEVDVMA